jgi:hypothetical protein
MSLLIVCFVVLLVVGLVCWLISTAPVLDARIKWALQAIAVLIGVLVILQRSGLVSG